MKWLVSDNHKGTKGQTGYDSRARKKLKMLSDLTVSCGDKRDILDKDKRAPVTPL